MMSAFFWVVGIACVSSVTAYGQCSPGWQKLGGRCFFFGSELINSFHQGESRCKAKVATAHLASIRSTAEHYYVLGMMGRAKEAYIGGRDVNHEGHWTWSDGSAFNYKNWGPNEPNNQDGNEHCMMMWAYTGKWNDVQCRWPGNYICSYDIQCSPGWQKLGNRCFYFGSDRVNGHKQGEMKCRLKVQTAHLASIHSKEEHDLVAGMMGSAKEAYIGGIDVKHEGHWTWSDGSAFNYKNWGPNEPNNHNGDEDCMMMWAYTGKWNDVQCRWPGNYVCSYDI